MPSKMKESAVLIALCFDRKFAMDRVSLGKKLLFSYKIRFFIRNDIYS